MLGWIQLDVIYTSCVAYGGRNNTRGAPQRPQLTIRNQRVVILCATTRGMRDWIHLRVDARRAAYSKHATLPMHSKPLSWSQTVTKSLSCRSPEPHMSIPRVANRCSQHNTSNMLVDLDRAAVQRVHLAVGRTEKAFMQSTCCHRSWNARLIRLIRPIVNSSHSTCGRQQASNTHNASTHPVCAVSDSHHIAMLASHNY